MLRECDKRSRHFLSNLWSNEKRMPDTLFTSWVICRPLIKASVNGVVVLHFTRNSSGLQRRRLIIAVWYLCSNSQVKEIILYKFIDNNSGRTESSVSVMYFTGSGQKYRNGFCGNKSFMVFYQFAKVWVWNQCHVPKLDCERMGKSNTMLLQ